MGISRYPAVTVGLCIKSEVTFSVGSKQHRANAEPFWSPPRHFELVVIGLDAVSAQFESTETWRQGKAETFPAWRMEDAEVITH